MPKFVMTRTINPYSASDVARLGAGTGAANWLTDKEVGKFVKLAADSRYNLAAVGDAIEGAIEAVEAATLDNFTVGSVRKDGRMAVILDGLQGTPGTGVIAIGELVVVGTPVAKDTALTTTAKVCKATAQTAALFNWRLVSASGTAVGSTGVIEKI